MIRIVDTALYQWDTGRYITTDIEADHVHFSNKGDSKAVIMELADSKAKIPDYLLQTGKQLCVYVVRNGITVESNVFSVNQRERPESYVYDEDQRNFVYALIASAKAATEAAKQAAGAATQTAQNADISANRANMAAEAAEKASGDANKAAISASQAAKSLMVVGEARGTAIHLDDAINQFLVGCRVFGKTTQDGTPTPDAPVDMVSVGARGSIGLSVCGGKNLIPYPYKNTSKTQGGITFNDNGDGSITINGTATINAYFVLCSVDFGNKWAGGTADSFTVGGYTFSLKNAVNDKVVLIYESGITKNLFIRVPAGATVSNLTVYPQAEYGSVATDYEPYKGQTLSVSIPNGLPGIPVTSGGNYTDANGQQRIGDVVDLGRGVRENRTVRFSFAVADMNGSESYPGWRNAGIAKYYPDASNAIGRYGAVAMCNIESNPSENVHINTKEGYDVIMMPNPNGMTQTEWKTQYPNLVFELIVSIPAPIETPLSEEELAAYASLHTYKDHTTVSNDAGAYMELEYVMDAKKYIDSLVTGSMAPATVE